jgi:hypothetical protein
MTVPEEQIRIAQNGDDTGNMLDDYSVNPYAMELAGGMNILLEGFQEDIQKTDKKGETISDLFIRKSGDEFRHTFNCQKSEARNPDLGNDAPPDVKKCPVVLENPTRTGRHCQKTEGAGISGSFSQTNKTSSFWPLLLPFFGGHLPSLNLPHCFS